MLKEKKHRVKTPKYFKASFLTKSYIVKDNVIVCQIRVEVNPNRNRDSITEVQERIWNEITFYRYIGTRVFTGKAKCHEGDNFDEKKGKYLAESRAKEKLYRWCKVKAREMEKLAKKAHEASQNTLEFYEAILERETQHIEELAHNECPNP